MAKLVKRTLVLLLSLVLLLGAAMPAASALVYGSLDDYDGGFINVFEDSSAFMTVGTEVQFRMTEIEGSTVYKLRAIGFSSQAPDVASVDDKGWVTALKPGTTGITMESDDGRMYTMALTVVRSNRPTKIRFSQRTLTTHTGVRTDLAEYLRAEPLNALLALNEVTWKSSRTSVVSVDKKQGRIIARRPGTATITATCGTKKATIKVTVKKNKKDNINPKPSLSKAGTRKFLLVLKSLEIVDPKTVAVEYYFVFNRPTNYTAKKFQSIDTEILLKDRREQTETLLIDGVVKDVKVAARGKTVTVIKVTYTGDAVDNTNVCLKKFYGDALLSYNALLGVSYR